MIVAITKQNKLMSKEYENKLLSDTVFLILFRWK